MELCRANSITYHCAQGAVIGGTVTNFQQSRCLFLSRTEWFFHGRGSTDVVLGYCWMARRYQEAIEILGIDMNRALDTIRRNRLMHILEAFLNDSELCMIQLLLADTTLVPQLAKRSCAYLIPLLAPSKETAWHLCYSLCIYRSSLTLSMTNDTTKQTRTSNRHKPYINIACTDNVDFVSHSRNFLDQMKKIIPTCLRYWFLIVSESKKERTSMRRETN